MGRNGGGVGVKVTSGETSGTSGRGDRWELHAMIGLIALSFAQNIANIATVGADRANNGLPDLGWELWLWELSSWIGFVLMLPFARRAARAFRPPRLPWPAVPLAHLPAAMLFSGGHVAIMLAIRKLAYRLAGGRYDFFGHDAGGVLLYEFRKDIFYYAGAITLLLMVRALADSRSQSTAQRPELEVKDGSRTVWLKPDEIASVEAAGNYVELTTGVGTLLHRTTLAAMESALVPQGFVRIHRSRLVRRDAIREVRTTPSGDFEVVLAEGRTLSGSRRYRRRLQT